MDIVLLILGIFFVLLGIAGSFLPVIPGPITSWIGLLLLHYTDWVSFEQSFLIITACVAIGVFLLDYIIPLLGTKQFGGSKSGMIGSTFGLLVGLLFLGPLGMIIGPFIGALMGELIRNAKNINGAVKAAFGSLIGFLTGFLLKFTVALIYAFFFFKAAFSSII